VRDIAREVPDEEQKVYPGQEAWVDEPRTEGE